MDINLIKERFLTWVCNHPDVFEKDHFWYAQNCVGDLIGWQEYPESWLDPKTRSYWLPAVDGVTSRYIVSDGKIVVEAFERVGDVYAHVVGGTVLPFTDKITFQTPSFDEVWGAIKYKEHLDTVI